ncbi:super-infection exclusion protein B [Chryseobacterium cucumeris]|uniref:super-infection exclusion protein B n=1 Tax=Chryseobacterium cucumeris TaxID=1813611 RepID=UPI003208CE63
MDKLTELLGKLFNIEKAPMQLIGVLFIASGVLIFAPEPLLSKLKLLKFQKEYDIFIGPVCASTALFLVISLIKYLYNNISTLFHIKRVKKYIKKDVAKLTYHEKVLLREFVLQNKDTIYAPMMNETVISLENKRIIYKASDSGLVTVFGLINSYYISEYAKKNMRFADLGLKENPDEEHLEALARQRPDWVYSLNRLNI